MLTIENVTLEFHYLHSKTKLASLTMCFAQSWVGNFFSFWWVLTQPWLLCIWLSFFLKYCLVIYLHLGLLMTALDCSRFVFLSSSQPVLYWLENWANLFFYKLVTTWEPSDLQSLMIRGALGSMTISWGTSFRVLLFALWCPLCFAFKYHLFLKWHGSHEHLLTQAGISSVCCASTCTGSWTKWPSPHWCP